MKKCRERSTLVNLHIHASSNSSHLVFLSQFYIKFINIFFIHLQEQRQQRRNLRMKFHRNCKVCFRSTHLHYLSYNMCSNSSLLRFLSQFYATFLLLFLALPRTVRCACNWSPVITMIKIMAQNCFLVLLEFGYTFRSWTGICQGAHENSYENLIIII